MQKSDWKKCKLKDCSSLITRGITPKYSTQGIFVLNQKCIRNGKISYAEARLHDNTAKKVSIEKFLQVGDTLVCSTGVGTLGRVGRFIESLPGTSTVDSHVTIVRPCKDIVPLFLSYAMINRQSDIESLAEGTTGQTELSRVKLGELVLDIPPLEEQKRIAEILGSLDDKIELLQKQNKTLEDMAKALFKSWFVDFDVVRAKQKGLPKADIVREYHLTEELYDLFPSSFADSPLGPIPSGWEVKPLGAFFPIRTGKKDANVASKEGSYPFFSCAQNVLWTNEYSFDETALLLAGNGDFNLKWYRGKFEAYQRTYVLIPNEKQDLPFLYYAMQFFLDKITLGSRGSVIKFITKGMIANYKLVIPEMHLWKSTGLLLGQWLDKIEMNNKEIQTLTELRDTLLPRLISGKIRV